MRMGLLDSIYALQCILNVLLEHIGLFYTAHCIFTLTNYSIREY